MIIGDEIEQWDIVPDRIPVPGFEAEPEPTREPETAPDLTPVPVPA